MKETIIKTQDSQDKHEVNARKRPIHALNHNIDKKIMQMKSIKENVVKSLTN
jgi:hypothetical protein